MWHPTRVGCHMVQKGVGWVATIAHHQSQHLSTLACWHRTLKAQGVSSIQCQLYSCVCVSIDEQVQHISRGAGCRQAAERTCSSLLLAALTCLCAAASSLSMRDKSDLVCRVNSQPHTHDDGQTCCSIHCQARCCTCVDNTSKRGKGRWTCRCICCQCVVHVRMGVCQQTGRVCTNSNCIAPFPSKACTASRNEATQAHGNLLVQRKPPIRQAHLTAWATVMLTSRQQ
jgi:hypothetical protein